MRVRLITDTLANDLDWLKKTIEVLWFASPAEDAQRFVLEFEQLYPGRLNSILFPSKIKEFLDKTLKSTWYRYYFSDGTIHDSDAEPWPKYAYTYQSIKYLYKDGCVDEEIVGRELFFNRGYCSAFGGKITTPCGTRIFHSYDRLI